MFVGETGKVRPRLGWRYACILILFQTLSIHSGSQASNPEDLKPANPLDPFIQSYQEIVESGGWPPVPTGPTLREGNHATRVIDLRMRLAATGDLLTTFPLSKDFDEALDQALRRFQRRHGLQEDGVLGPGTLTELNVPAEQRVVQLRLNRQRASTFTDELHVVINIPEFSLNVVSRGHVVLTMKVIVGSAAWKTPLFHDRIHGIVFNPYWYVPSSIAESEILPKVQADPAYLKEKQLKVLHTREARTLEVDPDTLDWKQISFSGSGYQFRQEAGPENSLGRVQFSLERQPGIRLHDSPARDLFEREYRALSHGCIRLENPLALADFLLRADPSWSSGTATELLEKGTHYFVKLANPTPVYVVYRTAWVSDNGVLQFRSDLYRFDGRQTAP